MPLPLESAGRMPAPHLEVRGVAAQVLSRLRRRPTIEPSRAQPDPERMAAGVRSLLAAVLAADAPDPARLLADLRRTGLSGLEITDLCIPAVARSLGRGWETDRHSFAEVTVGSGRLQSLLAHLMERDRLPVLPRVMLGPVLVAVPSGEHHTLGWKLLLLQLRRSGVPARGLAGATALETAQAVAAEAPSMLFLSGSDGRVLSHAAKVAQILRARAMRVPPIAVGGGVSRLLDGLAPPPDITRVTNCYRAALADCRTHPIPAAAE